MNYIFESSASLRILVIGGAGFIGSHMVKYLLSKGCHVTTLDNLSTGYQGSVLGGEFIKGDFGDHLCINKVLKRGFDAIMHFASFSQVGESIKLPNKYYLNNVSKTFQLLDAMVAHGVRKLIFSSSASIYGEPKYIPINEAHPKCPINPYGKTKLMVEQALADYDVAFGIKSVSLRYFNAAGADPGGMLGEMHEPETHLIPLVLKVALGKLPHVSIFGNDHDTVDGTCVRDFIHVQDLCSAHWLALTKIMEDEVSGAYNIGNGSGYSVNDVIQTSRKVTNKNIPIVYVPRRSGDPAKLVADAQLAKKELGFEPSFPDLETIIQHAWRWESRSK